MKNKLLILFSLCLIILPFISADTITPGYHGIAVNNYITNINDFPDYVFISAGRINTGMCPLKIIDNDGKLESSYKLCGIVVYAIPKNKFNMTHIEEMNLNVTGIEEVGSYFNSIDGKEVITGVDTYKEVSDVSPIKEENNYYTISLSQVKTEPDKVDTTKNKLIYVYMIVPIVAILIIIFILIKRKKK